MSQCIREGEFMGMRLAVVSRSLLVRSRFWGKEAPPEGAAGDVFCFV